MNLQGSKSTEVFIKKSIVITDDEGSKTKSYSNTPISLKGVISPLSGKLQVLMYGEQARYMLDIFISSTIELHETDGVCINVASNASPDYEIVSILDYKKCKQITVQKRFF
jgi:hypothetical protein